MFRHHDPEVLVVGAGPVGLIAALFLQQHGVRVEVIDMEQRTTQHSYALAIHPRTLRILDEAGLAEEADRRGAEADEGRLLRREARGEPRSTIRPSLRSIRISSSFVKACWRTSRRRRSARRSSRSSGDTGFKPSAWTAGASRRRSRSSTMWPLATPSREANGSSREPRRSGRRM